MFKTKYQLTMITISREKILELMTSTLFEKWASNFETFTSTFYVK